MILGAAGFLHERIATKATISIICCVKLSRMIIGEIL